MMRLISITVVILACALSAQGHRTPPIPPCRALENAEYANEHQASAWSGICYRAVVSNKSIWLYALQKPIGDVARSLHAALKEQNAVVKFTTDSKFAKDFVASHPDKVASIDAELCTELRARNKLYKGYLDTAILLSDGNIKMEDAIRESGDDGASILALWEACDSKGF